MGVFGLSILVDTRIMKKKVDLVETEVLELSHWLVLFPDS